MFLGVKPNVQDYLFAADCYVMPSFYEGLPVAGIEAECSGLPCFFSDNITEEVELGNQTHFLPLEAGRNVWVNKVMNCEPNENRAKATDYVRVAGYDIHDVAEKMTNFYLR